MSANDTLLKTGVCANVKEGDTGYLLLQISRCSNRKGRTEKKCKENVDWTLDDKLAMNVILGYWARRIKWEPMSKLSLS